VFAETKVIVPFGQGGGVELSLRHFEKYVNENKNVKFVAMMKPGAEGLIGLQELSKSPKDGTFIGYTTIGSVASVVKNNNLEFEYITATRKFTAVLVTNTKTNVKSYNDFSKRMKMGVPYAFGYNTPAQLLFINQVLDNVKPKTEVVKASYKSVSNVLTDLIGGQTDFAILPYAVVKDHVQSGKLIMLGSTSKLSVEPNLVAFDSLYKNWIDIAGYCFVAPKGTPQETITYWQNLINDYMNNSKVIEDFKQEESTTYALGSQNLKNIIQNINK
jgi:tripartite-type tricarboxylate transporter receptor subunit TctC